MSLSLSLSPLFALVACPAHHMPVLSFYSLICLSDRLSLIVSSLAHRTHAKGEIISFFSQLNLLLVHSTVCGHLHVLTYVFVSMCTCVSLLRRAFKCNLLNDLRVSFTGDKMVMI